MEYRRFGETGVELSVITLGGMRYKGGWSDPRHEPHREMVEHAMDTLTMALDAGINHIETAYGYGKSEFCHGEALAELCIPRERYSLMTKGDPVDGDAAHRMIEEQLRGLRTDRFDFYAWHGLNNEDRLSTVLGKNGPMKVLQSYVEQGVIGHLGFSTHAPLDIVAKAILSDLFSFVNLHYYYFFQRNWAAIDLARAKDMGVFIISPNDKGGNLWDAPALVKDAVAPLTPIQWNARFCLRSPAVHTLSFGMTAAAHFNEMFGIFPTSVPLSQADLDAQVRLDSRVALDPLAQYDGYEHFPDPSGINIPEVLRFRKLLKCYDMEAFGKYRYNMLEEKGHWFPGSMATEERIERVDMSRVPAGFPLREMLREAHAALFVPKEKKA
jgi:hypothetical protein